MEKLLWTRWDWTVWELHHPRFLLIPAALLAIFLIVSKLKNR